MPGTDLDPWHGTYAARASGLSVSEVRALFAVASRPEVVSLAGGMPYVRAIPRELIATAVDRVLLTDAPAALQYGSGQGMPRLREHILEIMALEGIEASADDVVTTTGSQQAIDLVTKLFIDPGDVILAEGPSYVGALGVFSSYQARVVHVPMDEHGLVPEALEAEITRQRAAGSRMKFLYTIPTFHNPAGVTMSAERRPRILEICRREHLLVVEDNPYGLLSFDETPPQPLRTLDPDNVVYLGSFSKTFAPGFRVGWALAPLAIREKLVLATESAILSPSSFSQHIICEYMETVDWRGQIVRFREVYRERRDAMLAALATYLPNLTWTVPNGGFYVWVKLPSELHSKQMLPRAVRELVAYTPGTGFYADGQGGREIRLSFCYPTPDEIRVGIQRLAAVVNGELELVRAFSGTGSLAPGSGDRAVSAPPPDLR
ncbi:PLP-dependent aminotransferase family protein [Amnibacterium sp. CER49]|uniref:aminotransferase-like domain-containing protein n=1 Tax=Amnibacterium sp. CER49 TaxID=3039161 RepID=UPI002448F62F|nr:PLP-dependent aminotransferase family protein [Amnibacterium sp. CER49]MDH2443634.1 PLP-dependent aminotransferase family protein [Amnibacterium sp. CER49]